MLENVSFLEKIGAGLVGVATVSYLWFRRIKNDTNNDTVDVKTQKFIDNLTEQLNTKVSENERLHTSIERVSTERNEAVQRVGKLEATVELLGQKVEEMKGEVSRLESENEQLISVVDELRKENIRMSENVRQLTQKVVELLDAIHSGEVDGNLANIKKSSH